MSHSNSQTPLSTGNKVVLWLIFLSLLAVVSLNLLTIFDEYKMHVQGGSATAQITDWAIYMDPAHPNTRKDYEVQYEFSVDGETYTFGDSTGRTNLWASLKKADWEESQKTQVVEVVYQKSNPAKNRPLHPDEWPYGGPLAGIVIAGGMAALLGWVLLKKA